MTSYHTYPNSNHRSIHPFSEFDINDHVPYVSLIITSHQGLGYDPTQPAVCKDGPEVTRVILIQLVQLAIAQKMCLLKGIRERKNFNKLQNYNRPLSGHKNDNKELISHLVQDNYSKEVESSFWMTTPPISSTYEPPTSVALFQEPNT